MQSGFNNRNNGKKGFGLRFVTIVVVVALLFGALSLQLANLQLRDGQTYADTAESRTMKTYSLTGERGMILDRNGIPLAYDVESYNVTFYRDPSRNSTEDVQEYTQILLRVLEIVEENGRLTTTGAKRTGCMFCMFGVHLEKKPNRFQSMALTHPKQYDFCIHKLGCGKVLDFLDVPYAPNGGETP